VDIGRIRLDVNEAAPAVNLVKLGQEIGGAGAHHPAQTFPPQRAGQGFNRVRRRDQMIASIRNGPRRLSAPSKRSANCSQLCAPAASTPMPLAINTQSQAG